MDILIIGNGFDLAHGLPTTYSDFLDFIDIIKKTKKEDIIDNKLIKNIPDNMNISVKKYLIFEFHKYSFLNGDIPSNEYSSLKEICDNLKDNIWFDFFEKLRSKNLMKGINWIDFESEISHIIELIDKCEENLYSPIDSILSIDDEKIKNFITPLNLEEFKESLRKENVNYTTTFRDLLDKTYNDLRKLIRCMEIYFSNCVENIARDALLSKKFFLLEDILQISNVNAVLNFNYTHTLENSYNYSAEKIHYIHGETQSNNAIRGNNMVLGIDEYRVNGEQNSHTNYNIYKKFTQRIINDTGFKHRDWIETINLTSGSSKLINNIYIFGHSLDVTDKDILREFIMNTTVKTTVFYHNKSQQAQQIANLVKMIGQENFINKINSVPPSIIFKEQSDEKVSKDITKNV